MTAAELRRAAVAKAFGLLTGGADFDVSAATARERAKSREWAADQGHETRDFIALVLDSELLSKELEDSGQENVADLLDRSWLILAKKDGYDPNKPQKQTGSPVQANAVAIVAAVIGIVAVAAVVAYLIYRASQIVSAEIAIHASSQELVRAHSDAMTVIEAHRAREAKAGKALPYDAGELAILQGLQAAQDAAQKVQTGTVEATKGSPFGASEGALLTILVLGAGALYLASRK